MSNSLALFNALKQEAKSLGIDIKGLKRPEIEQAIRDAQAKFEEENQDVVEEIPEVKVEDVPTTEPISNVTDETVHGVATAEIKRLGRPVNLNSSRQIRLAEQARLREEGKLKRGRPIVEGCARQARLEAIKAKMEAGIPIKPGRPKMIKPEVVIAENVVSIEEVHPITEEVVMPTIPVENEVVQEQSND